MTSPVWLLARLIWLAAVAFFIYVALRLIASLA